MSSAVVTDVYFIQLEDIPNPNSTAGNLWQFDSDELVNAYETARTDSCFTLKCCSFDRPHDTWERVPFRKDCERYFSRLALSWFRLLLAVKDPRSRLDLLRNKEGLLKFAAALSLGSRVGVWVSNGESNSELVTGVIRHIGPLPPNREGWHFGVEFEPQFAGKGASNGIFGKHRYFECEEDGAMFVSVAKLEQLQSSFSSSNDSTYSSDQSFPGTSHTQRSVADILQTCRLAINDRIVWMNDNGPEFGTVRWIGVLPDAASPPRDASQLTVGVEFDNPVGSGTGRYQSHTLFSARRRHASLVPIMGLLKESDLDGYPLDQQFQSVSCADSNVHPKRSVSVTAEVHHRLPDVVKDSPDAELPDSECKSGMLVIHLDTANSSSSVDRKGCVQPPSVADADMLCGLNRGVQPYSGTCALEAIVFALFAFCSYFDEQLFAEQTGNLVGDMKNILVQQIVNPLRASYFVSRDKILRFGDLFSMIQSAKLASCATSSITLSDDPSGTITAILSDVLQVDPLITLVNNTSSFVYNVDVSGTSYPFPCLQHVIECSVVKNPNRRLLQHPQSVFIVNVDATRFGKLVPCGRIFPELILDISGILCFSAQSCRECGQKSSCVCGDCFTDGNMREGTDVYKLLNYTFCEDCFDKSHQVVNRHDHKPLPVSSVANKSLQELRECTLFELFSIVSFINGHYVSFLKVGTAWLMYDAMAAIGRTANSQMYVPEIKRCQEIATFLKDIPSSQRSDSLPDIIVKLTSGLRLCFYRTRHM